ENAITPNHERFGSRLHLADSALLGLLKPMNRLCRSSVARPRDHHDTTVGSMRTHGSLIFKVVCENRDRAAYRCQPGRRGAQERAVVCEKAGSDDGADGGLPG